MRERSLSQWLDFIALTHPQEIEMGLERCQLMLQRLNIDFTKQSVITVGGTNGKGTTCAFIEQACLDAGLSVGVFSSPHIHSFCERIRLNNCDISESDLCDVFTHIESLRGDIALTYFEYATLAALEAFKREAPDIVLLEVGLGGRLDAVNIIDPDIAVITSIGLDHQDYLGNTKTLIAAEKAGIFRPNIPIVIGEEDCPASMVDIAESLSDKLRLRQRDFTYKNEANTFSYQAQCFDVSQANIPKQNIATGIVTLTELACKLKHSQKFLLSNEKLQVLIESVSLKGRHQIINDGSDGQAIVIGDVAHNEDSAKQLCSMIAAYNAKRYHIVVGMLKDKNIEVSLQMFSALTVDWYCASIQEHRGEDAQRLVKAAEHASSLSNQKSSIQAFENVKSAYQVACSNAKSDDLILVMGSFLTVAEVL